MEAIDRHRTVCYDDSSHYPVLEDQRRAGGGVRFTATAQRKRNYVVAVL